VELRVRYGVSDATLRRRRDELARLGVVYVEAGRGSHYRAIAPVFDPDAPPPDVPIAIGDPAPVEHDGRLAFILDELRLQDGRTIRDAAETDPWIVDELLRPVFQTDGDGLPLHRLIYNELARGHGKSLYAAAFALAEATLYPSTEVIVAAADTEQASIILEHIDGFTARSPMLQTLIERAPNVRLFAGRSRVRVIASDAASAWGHGGVYRRFRLILDELTAWKDRGEQLWEALASATGKVADAQTICLGNSGWNADRAWQYKVRETAEREPWARLFSPEGTLASWISRKWLDQQRSLLPPASFERLHLNRWISQEGDFVSAQQLDACVDSTLARIARGRGAFYGGLDLGLTKDRTAFAIVQARNGRFELCEMQVWQGTRSQPVSIEMVERAIIAACERFPGLRIDADKWQLESVLQRLRAHGVAIEKFEFSPASVQRLSESLYRCITSRTLALPPGEHDLRQEILGLVTRETANGWRFDHRAGGFSDMAVALAMAVHLAERKSRRVPMAIINPNSTGTRVPLRVQPRLSPQIVLSDLVREIGEYDGIEAASSLGLRGIDRTAA
jgi:hypothetical protein